MSFGFLFLSFIFTQLAFWTPVRFKGRSAIAFVLRRTSITLPYLFYLRYFSFVSTRFDLLGVVSLMAIVGILIWVEKEEYQFKSSTTYAKLAGPLKTSDFWLSIYNISLFVIAEESFFRLGILSINSSALAVVIQAMLFVAGHYFTPWGKSFKIKDLVRQFVFSLAAGFYFLVTKDLFLCVFAHLFLNSPELIHIIRRLRLKTEYNEAFRGAP